MKFLGQNFSKKELLHWIPRLIVVIILAQTLPFKYLGAEESVMIFTRLDMEPFGRYLIAVIETTAVIFLLSRYYIFGAIVSLSIISAANFLHFVKLGLVVNDDGGTLFVLSLIVIICSLWIVIYWNKVRTRKKRISFQAPDLEETEI